MTLNDLERPKRTLGLTSCCPVVMDFEACVFYLHRVQKQSLIIILGEVENEYTLHNSIVLAILVPKIIKVGGNLTKF